MVSVWDLFFIMEIYVNIKGYDGFYQVSNKGNVKSLKKGKETILKPAVTGNGYLGVNLYANNGQKTRTIHQLVAEAFLNHKPCWYDLVVNHKDFNKLNNNVENLEIVTHRENLNKKHIKSTSKYTGVHLNKASGKWCSQMSVNGRTKRLGFFDTEEEASEYYQNALIAIEKGFEIVVKKNKFSSQYRGVMFNKGKNNFRARIIINGKQKHLGYFTNEIEAHNAYQTALNGIN